MATGAQGYRLLAAFDPEDDARAAAVASFRSVTSLSWGDAFYT